MSETKKKRTVDSEERLESVVAIITVLVTLALIVGFFWITSRNAQALGSIASAEQLRRGSEQQFTCEVLDAKIKDGTKVVWTVNGKKVEESVYKKDEPLTLNYTPEIVGQNSVTVKVGKYKRGAMINVLPPELTFIAPNITITYGDDLPELGYVCNGFVDDDNFETMCYDGVCHIAETANSGESCSKLSVGVYKIQFDKPCCYKDYEVNYVEGTLTVLPKQLNVTDVFEKTYDQTNVIETPNISLKGIIEGDDVKAVCDKLYFDNKNAGTDKKVMLANVILDGADSSNYVLCGEAKGVIKPKLVDIDGLTIKDKVYDGTTKATIDKMGTLNGVINGDSVAIGNVNLSFSDAYIGEKEIVINNVSLVGADKDNYVVNDVKIENANITSTVWDKLFKNDPVVAG